MPTITIRLMTLADVPLGMRLKTEAGWNQTEDDWRRVLALEPQGNFVGQLDDVDVGTVSAVRFGLSARIDSVVAWIGLMLVDESARGQGVGRSLMQRALDYLDGMRVKSIRLDATPLGRPLYEKLGFHDDFELDRYAGVPQAIAAPAVMTKAFNKALFNEIVALDQQGTGAVRQRFLLSLATNPPLARACEHKSQLAGYLLTRAGSQAVQVGPCIATATAGPALLADALTHFAARQTNVYVDVPRANTAARAIVEQAGLACQRPLFRMTRGPKVHEKPELLWASSGPEKG